MNQVFPYANIVTGVLVLIVGFGFHWIGQLISVLDWDLAMRIGIQEKDAPPEYKVYEHGIAVADVAVAWTYGIAAVGLVLDAPWGYKWAWFPGVLLIYHSIGFWFCMENQRRAGHQLMTDSARIGWTLANVITGILAILVAWNAI